MYEIEISNEQSILSFDESFIREVAESVFEIEQVEAARLSIAFVDNQTMRELNVRHLNHDYDTDVLSFLLECHTNESTDVDSNLRGAGKSIEGEVVISAEMACQCAEEFDWTAENELVLYLVHGLLHLVGYDDLTESERELMRSRERSILQTWDLNPHYAEDKSTALDGGNGSSSDDEPPPASRNPSTGDSTEDHE